MSYDQNEIQTVTEVNLTKDLETNEKYLNQYKLISKLGNGHTAKVYLAKDDQSNLFALKEISKVTKISILNKNPRSRLERIDNEIKIMKLLVNHPKILKLYQVLDDPKSSKIFLILEYCSKGELNFGSEYKYSVAAIRSIIRDVILGLEYLHSMGIVHRDIKPSNLLITDDYQVKISDFGISHSIEQVSSGSLSSETLGTPAFLAPELCKANNLNQIGFKIDIWALGITLYCLFYQTLPFNGKNEFELFNEIITLELQFKDSVGSDSESFNDLVSKMLNKSPTKRIPIEEIKSHGFVVGNLTKEERLKFINFNDSYLDSKNNTQPKLISALRETSLRKPKPKDEISPSTIISIPSVNISSMSLPEEEKSQSSTPTRPALTKSSLSASTKSLNLNSLLRSKKEVPDYLDDSTLFHGMDSDSLDSESDDDDDDSDNQFYNDGDDRLTFRTSKRDVRDYLGI